MDRRVDSGGASRILRLRSLVLLLLLAALAVGLVSTLSYAAISFPDVPTDHPYRAAILDLSSRGIVTGYDNGNFGPADPVRRQQFAKMAVLTFDLPVTDHDVCPFSDVTPTPEPGVLYPDHYVAVVAHAGITQGKTGTEFAPYAYISRAQVVTMVVRALNNLHPGLLEQPPQDYGPSWPISFSADHGLNCRLAEWNGLLAGLPLRTLDPWGDVSRAEVAQVLHNALVRLGSTTTTGASTTTTGAVTTTSSTTTTEAPGKDLLHFSWSPGHDWQVENVSDQTGVKVDRPLAAWNQWTGAGAGPHQVFASSPLGNETSFFWSISDPDSWDVEALSPRLGGRVPAQICPVQVGSSLLKDVFARKADGGVFGFVFSPGSNPEIQDVTQATGKRFPGGITGWGADMGTIQNDYVRLGGVDSAGHLWFMRWVASSFWLTMDLSASTGYYLGANSLVGFEGFGTQYISGIDPQGHLLVFRSDLAKPAVWVVDDLGSPGGQTIVAVAGMWLTGIVGHANCADHLVALTSGGHVMHLSRPVATKAWVAEDVTAKTGVSVASCVPGSGQHVDDDTFVNHIWGVTPSGDLVVFWDYASSDNWQVVNITQKTGAKVAGPLIWWYSYEDKQWNDNVAAVAAK
jgi:hypothetical protein